MRTGAAELKETVIVAEPRRIFRSLTGVFRSRHVTSTLNRLRRVTLGPQSSDFLPSTQSECRDWDTFRPCVADSSQRFHRWPGECHGLAIRSPFSPIRKAIKSFEGERLKRTKAARALIVSISSGRATRQLAEQSARQDWQTIDRVLAHESRLQELRCFWFPSRAVITFGCLVSALPYDTIPLYFRAT
jgi:hypothetical protein